MAFAPLKMTRDAAATLLVWYYTKSSSITSSIFAHPDLADPLPCIFTPGHGRNFLSSRCKATKYLASFLLHSTFFSLVCFFWDMLPTVSLAGVAVLSLPFLIPGVVFLHLDFSWILPAVP
jgi:hypothetical protein